MHHRTRTGALTALALSVLVLAAACSGGDDTSGPPPTTAAPPEPLQLLVTNDDGVGAEGLDVLVEALRAIPDVELTVVAPAEDQSGASDQTTTGPLVSSPATTASGHPAVAVEGFAADVLVWAVDQANLGVVPDLVVVGLDAGQALGPAVDASGAVAAARAAAARGLPALAASQGLAYPLDYGAGAAQVVAWITTHRDALVERSLPTDTIANLNVPTCRTGSVRGSVEVPLAPTLDGTLRLPDCASTAEDPPDDVAAYLAGFAPVSPVPTARAS